MSRHRSGFGRWGKHIELFRRYESFADDPRVQEAFAGELEEAAVSGTGAPEGRPDFPIYLQTVIRHRMRERFRTVAAKWDQYMGEETAQDFREHTVSQMNGIVGIEGIAEDGEYKRLRSSEEVGPSFAIGKHGGIYGVTLELVINDEVDKILNRIPREMGRSFAEYISRVIVAFVESNPTYGPDGQPFFSVAHGNITTGAGADPNETNLFAILDEMKLRRSDDDIPFTVEPNKILVRTPSQKARFDAIIRSQLTGGQPVLAGSPAAMGFGDFLAGNYNPAYNVLPPDAVIDEPWLNAPNAWYLLGNPEDRAAFLVAFLRGNREPFIGLRNPEVRSAFSNTDDPYDMWFDRIDYKGRHFFGVSAGEPLAAHKAVPS